MNENEVDLSGASAGDTARAPTNTTQQPCLPDTSYAARHWRGELSLAWSYWINGVIVWIATGLLTDSILEGPTGSTGDLWGRYAILGILQIVFVWQLVGIWRSAERHPESGGSRFWANIAKVMVVAAVASLVAPILKAIT